MTDLIQPVHVQATSQQLLDLFKSGSENPWVEIESTMRSFFSLYTLLSLTPVILGQDQSVDQVKAAFEEANIPEDLTIEFDPTALLQVQFPQSSGPPVTLHAGIQVPRNETVGPPTFSVMGAGVGQGPFVIATVDPDAPTPQMPNISQFRHFLGGNFILDPSGSGTLENQTAAVSEFVQPAPPVGSDAHRYVFLLFDQSSEFNNQTLVNTTTSMENFNISEFAAATCLGDPIAGTFMLVAPDETST